MLPNKQCMKDILKYVSEHSRVKVDQSHYNNIGFGSLDITKLLNDMSQDGEYTIEDIAYNFIQCYNNQLVDAKLVYRGSDIESSKSSIQGITFVGIDFMNQN